jgi:hypothetical protein
MTSNETASRSTALWTEGKAPRRKWITMARAARLVDAITAINQCVDVTPELRRALEDARQAISPWYDQ